MIFALGKQVWMTFLHTMVETFQHLPDKIVGDSGYGSESNCEMIMDDYERTTLIPYNTYYKEKKKKYKDDEMHPAYWPYDAVNDLFICPDGREIRFDRYANRTDKYGYTRSFKMYASDDCSGCSLYDMCINRDKTINKQIQKNMNLEYFKAQVPNHL